MDAGYAGLDLPDQFDTLVTFNLVKNTFANTNKMTLTLAPKTGALSGSFFHPPGSKTSLGWHGVVIDGVGYGCYSKSNETGPVWLGNPEPPTPDAP